MPKRILITPLDWGLGHATRCIPIIRLLIHEGHHVIIGGSGNSFSLLRKEFPELLSMQLPGYEPEYSNGDGMVSKMALQIPKFLKVIRYEYAIVEKYVKENSVDLIISDNRFGCRSENVTSVFITHQSNIIMPSRFGWISGWVKRTNEAFMNKFDEVWIPDYPDEDSLAGELISFDKRHLQTPVQYIGVLSRFSSSQQSPKKYDVVVVCSGPEPQRSIFEKLMTDALSSSNHVFLIVRGVVVDGEPTVLPNGSTIINFMTSDQLEHSLQEGELVISRSGYSTIMDLCVLGKRVVFIPTPGQTEQEYLANRLEEKGTAFFMEQSKFDLEHAVTKSKEYSGFVGWSPHDLLTSVVQNVLSQ